MSLWQIFRWPALIAVLTLTGLVTGLVSDSWGDVLAALGLFLPAAVGLWHALRRRPVPRLSHPTHTEAATQADAGTQAD